MTIQKQILDVEEAIYMYRHLLKPNPNFGTDIYAKNYKSEGVVLIEDESTHSKGLPIRFDCYALILRLQGSSIRNVNQYSYDIESCSLQLINPGSLFSFNDISDSAKSFVLLFDEEFIKIDNLALNMGESLFSFHKQYEENVQLDLNLYEQVIDIYEHINSEFKIKNSGYINFIKIYINQLLYILKREKQRVQNEKIVTQSQKLSSNFLSLVEDNFKDMKKISDYANLLGVTPNHLSQTVNSEFKDSALSYIHKRIIREIQYLLSLKNISIKQISSILNFDSHSQMSRFYKHNTGLTPKEFREKSKI